MEQGDVLSEERKADNGCRMSLVSALLPVVRPKRVIAREYSASEIRKLLQQLFPQRRLVLSQFTFFNQIGVARATGLTFRRGRRCYRLEDILSIACVIALKEEGIPLKNVETVPALVQERAQEIFHCGAGCRLSGYGDTVTLVLPQGDGDNRALDRFLDSGAERLLFWGFDVGLLAEQLEQVAQSLECETERQAA